MIEFFLIYKIHKIYKLKKLSNNLSVKVEKKRKFKYSNNIFFNDKISSSIKKSNNWNSRNF